MIPPSEQVKEFFGKAFPALTPHQMYQLEKYADMTASFNRETNLVSRKDVPNLWEHHILPSLIVLKMTGISPNANVVDVGSGGGFPGIPLKIVRPDLRMILVDSVRKKTLFLRKVIEELTLSGIRVLNERLLPDEVPDELSRKFQVALARAVTDIESLYFLARPLLVEGGFLLAWKGETDLPALEEFVGKTPVGYRVLCVPPQLQKYSKKFEMLRIFLIEGGR